MNQRIKALLIMLLAFTTHWVQAQNVAKVGSTEYATIQEAIDAWGPGKTLTLLADVTTTSPVEVMINATVSTQGWTLNLGDFTWTASGCNAFNLKAAGGTAINQNYGFKINANQSGGITAQGKYAIQYSDDKNCSDSRGYRPRLEINGGTYNASYVVYYGTSAYSSTKNGASVFLNKSADGTEPVFNGNFGLSKCPVTVNAGYFNGTRFTVYRVSSTVDPRLNGGHFKTYSAFPVPGNDKGIVFDNYKVFVRSDASIDITNGAPATYEAKATKTLLLTANQSVAYSDYVYYEKANDAINKYSSGTIEIVLSEGVNATQNKTLSSSGTLTIDATAEGAEYTGNITLSNNSAKFVIIFPQGEGHYGVTVNSGTLHVEETVADGIVTRTYTRIGTVSNPEAQVGSTNYSTVYDAFYAIDGTTTNQTITLLKDVTNAGIITNGKAASDDGKTVATFDLNGHSIGIGSAGAGNQADYTLTIIDSSEGKTGTVTNSDASLFLLALTGISDYSGTYTLKIQAGTWMFDPSNVTINGETYNMVDEGYVAYDNGNGTWTVREMIAVAKIGETKYSTLQSAVNAAQQMGGAQTINIVDDISEATVTIKEVANFKLTIDGQKDASSNYTVDATIVVDGLRGNGGSTTNGASVTLQNIAFVKTTSTDGIQASHYPHHLTIQDCTYSGSDNDKWFLNASVDGPLYGVTVKNVTVEHARLIYANMAEDAVFENITATNDAKVGFNVKTSGTALIKDCQVTTGKYAFRDYSDGYEGTFTLEGNTFVSTTEASDEGVIVNRGGAVGTAHINVESGTYTGHVKVLNNKEGVLAISGGYFSEEFPQEYIAADLAAQGQICIPATDKEGYFTVGYHYVAQIGETKFASLAAAVTAAQANDVITMIDDDNVSLTAAGSEITIDKPLTITGAVDENGKPKFTIFGSTNGALNNNSFNDLFLSCSTGTVTISNLKFDGFGNEISSVMGHSPVFIGSRNQNAVIENVYISNLNCEGIHINGGSFTIKDCNIDCSKTSTSIFTKGICVVNDAQGSIENTTITGVDCDDPNDTSAAIELQGSGDIAISGCTIQTNTIGIATTPVADLTAGTSQVTISDCTIESQNIAVYSNGDKGALTSISSGRYSGLLMAGDNDEGLSISGGLFDDMPEQAYCAEGYAPADNTDAATMEAYPYTVLELPDVAQIGDVKYKSLQAALDAAHEMTGDVTIELLDNISGYSIVHQKAGVNITIDGADKTVAGQIIIDGNGRLSGTETLTIQNVKFEGDKDDFLSGTDAFVLIPNTKDTNKPYTTGGYNYAHNVTVKDCSFTSTSSSYNVVGVKVTSGAGSKNVVLSNDTGTNLHSLAQLTGTTGGTIENNTVTQSESFLNVSGGEGDFTVSGNMFTSAEDAEGYGVRENGTSAATINLTGNTFTATNPIVLGKGGSATNGTINVVDGIYTGTIKKDIAESATGKIVVSGGYFSEVVPEEYIVEGKICVTATDKPGYYTIKTGQFVAQIGDVKYETLEEAFGAAEDGATITLLANCDGNGIKVPQGKYTTGLTVDFNNFTYEVTGNLVGSSGTETQGFQLLKDNTITFKNGTITSSKALFLVQNYSNLTLEGMTLTLANDDYTAGYTLSNNNGNIVIDGSTINVNTGGGFAFDVCRNSSYPSVSVTVTGDSEINGNVEVSASGSDAKDGFTLMLESGKINGELVIDPTAAEAMASTPEKALVKENDSFGQAAPTGFKWESIGEGVSKLVARPSVAQIDDVKYYSLVDAVAAVPTDGTETTITMIANEMIDVVGYAITIPATKNVVLDLNGFEVVGTATEGNTSALITNKGTLTIKDSSDTNKDGTGTGKLMSGASTTWTWDGSDDYTGSYASNLIRNEKDLIVESGYLYNMSTGSAAYGIDNYNAGNVTINGGKVDAAKASAIRMFYINGGSVSVTDGVIGHYVSDSDCTYMGIQVMGGTNANVTITGGTIAGNYALYGGNTGGDITISGGTFDGYVGFAASVPNISITDGAFTCWVGTWGDQTKFISGGIYAEEVDEEYIADGYILTDNTDEATKEDYPYTVRTGLYVAQIGTTKYESLADAIDAVGDGETITMIADVDNAAGLSVPSGKNFTVDFDGHTYTLNKPGAGSTGTETIGFQLLMNSTIVFKNGTINISEDNLTPAVAPAKNIKRIIQNYANLTLEDMTIDGTNQFGDKTYVVSFNNGTSNIIGSTSITAGETGVSPIMDVYLNSSYTGTNVTINTTGVIGGDIETCAVSQEKADACSLTITNADVLGTIKKDGSYEIPVSVSGGIYDEEVLEQYCAKGYVCVPTDDGRFTVITKEDAGIFDLVDWENYPYTEEKQATQLTYSRRFINRVGKCQPWIVPFDYEITEEDAENFDFYKINLIASSMQEGEISDDQQIYVNIQKVGAGYVLKANRPYELKPKGEFGVDNPYVFKAQNVTLKVPDTETSRLHTETSRLAFDFYANYTIDKFGKICDEPTKCFCLSASGTLMWLKANSSFNSYRWYAYVTDKYGEGGDDYSNWTFVMSEDDPTGIYTFTGVDPNEIEGIYTPSGVKIDTPVKGINIIKFTNGTTKKVYIK